MKIFNLKPQMSVNDLIEHGISVELYPSNTIMRLQISDKDLTKFKCDLIEADYPTDYPETNSILEFNLKKPLKSINSPFGHITTAQFDDLIFGYLEHELLPSIGVQLVEVV
jgi:hypothetical protein